MSGAKKPANKPAFKMERVGGELPPDPNPPKRGQRGRSPMYLEVLNKGVAWFWDGENADNRTPWWLVAEHSERRGSEAVLAKLGRGEIAVPPGTTWEFETRKGDDGKGQLYGRLVSCGGPPDA